MQDEKLLFEAIWINLHAQHLSNNLFFSFCDDETSRLFLLVRLLDIVPSRAAYRPSNKTRIESNYVDSVHGCLSRANNCSTNNQRYHCHTVKEAKRKKNESKMALAENALHSSDVLPCKLEQAFNSRKKRVID